MKTTEQAIRKELKSRKLSYGSITFRRVLMIQEAIDAVSIMGFERWNNVTTMPAELKEVVKTLSK